MSKYIPLLLLTIVLVSILVIPTQITSAQATQPGPASDKIVVTRKTIEEVPDAITSGKIDGYLYSLRPAQAAQLQGVSGVTLYSAPAGLIELTLNPAPVAVFTLEGALSISEAASKLGIPAAAITNLYTQGGKTVVEVGAYPGKGVNPFAFKEIRFAMNYLIDRVTVASTIMKGFAVPMYTFLSQYDPDYATIADIIAKYEFAYNPSYVDQVVTNVLTKVGAVKIGGKWTYEGQPITIKFIIRQEDERRDIGYTFSSELKKLGFEVNEMEMPFAQAINIIYGTDPIEFQWQIYTAGWGKGGIDRYDYGSISQFCAPWYGYMPGWGETGFWNYKNDIVDELTLRIYQANYTNKEERNELYRKAAELCIQDSVRIWVVTRLDTWPMRSEVKGITLDLGAGLRGIWNLREMYVEGRNTLNLAHLWVWTSSSAWNIWGGFSDVYSVDFERATYDPSVWNHPFNGGPLAFRAPYVVVTAGPSGKLNVSSNAVIWDASKKQWVPVPNGTQATSKVIFDFSKLIGAKFHNGITISWADVIGFLAYMFDIVYDPTYSSLETRISSSSKPWANTIKGFEFDFNNKRVTVYVDYWHFDENYIASWASFSPVNPVEIHAVTFELALDRRNETNYVLYQKKNYEWFSLVWPDHVAKVKATLQSYKNNQAVLNKVNKYAMGTLNMNEWNARIDADLNWINTYNLAWISYGPFMLTKLDTQNQVLELTAFRDPTYPFKKGDWYFGQPVATSIVSVSIESPIQGKILPGQTANITVKLSGIPPFSLKYMIRDPRGIIITSGDGLKVSEDTFRVVLDSNFTKTLAYGSTYTVILVGLSEEVAIPGITRQVVNTATLSEALSTQSISDVLANVKASALEQVNIILSQLKQERAVDLESLRDQLATAISGVTGVLIDQYVSLIGTAMDNMNRLSQTTASTITSQVSSQIQQIRSDVTALSEKLNDTQATVSSLQTYIVVNIVLTLVAIVLSIIALVRKPKA
ncbi:Predicted solute binding protein [Desulfurococcus amylolyticus 1221n]|uniref:Predicted solute binding protein n=1 Tax=Desulfurococcus amylolyticus (strain DSM 18924 / JCM 16383 / VKM B-2413 / 1221n) TaxID=490899 RepID=B8D3P2_DESA1|nr:ABC transporter substrate-binding protein [Desulfurococcus amylolyticus]ACL10723.1 Predicted solute binding protein [Desulfurococcus amylolyticus 1221n]